MRPAIRFRLGIALLLAVSASADVPIRTETWNAASGFWIVAAGTPAYGNSRLRNAASDLSLSRLIYEPEVSSYDYSLESVVYCGPAASGNYPSAVHYLRASGSDHYRILAMIFPPSAGYYWIGVWVTRVMTGGPGSADLAYFAVPCAESVGYGILKSAIVGSTITVSWNGGSVTASDSNLATGKPGVGTYQASNAYTAGLGTTTLAYADTTTPTAPPAVVPFPFATSVYLGWTHSTDDTGVTSYKVFRATQVDGPYTQVGAVTVGSEGCAPPPGSPSCAWLDMVVEPVTPYFYQVSALDSAANESPKSSPIQTVTLGLSLQSPNGFSPVAFNETWGAGVEQLSMLTGALGFRLPLLKLQHRSRGPGFALQLAWNSQFWSRLGTTDKLEAIDVGYGLGMLITLGTIYPVYSGNFVDHYLYQDASGLVHKLTPIASGSTTFVSTDSTHLTWDSVNNKLTTSGGVVYSFDCVSRMPEADAGARSVTSIRDANGNIITITYQAAQGQPGTNSSARIATIVDSAATYTFWYGNVPSSGGSPHLYQISWGTNPFQFSYADAGGAQTLNVVSPFDGTTSFGARVVLRQVTVPGAPGPFKLEYNSSAELTQLWVPHKGYLKYIYANQSFQSGARTVREVVERRASSDGTVGSEQSYTFTHPAGDSAQAGHTETTLGDASNNRKVWSFTQSDPAGWKNGLLSKYEVQQGPGPSYVMKQKVEPTWSVDANSANPRVTESLTTLEGGAVQSKSARDFDANGNVTEAREYYGDLANPWRSVTTTYETNSSYTNLGLKRLAKQIKVYDGPATGTPLSTTTITYDSAGLVNVPGIGATHDTANYPQSFNYRGNPTVTNVDGISSTAQYDIGGNVTSTAGTQNTTITLNATASQVTQVIGGGNTTNLAWNGDTTLSSVTGSNSDTTNYYYTSYRPTSIRNAAGQYTIITYQDAVYPLSRTETSPGGQVRKTFYDGFGRTLKTAVKESASPEVWIVSETQYAPCSCTPLGKPVKVSRPYRADANLTATETVYWTETIYDALGRVIQVKLPDNTVSNTAYFVVNESGWRGTVTAVTEPALPPAQGKQKWYLHNERGQLVWVAEPDPDNPGQMKETARYTFDKMGRLTKVEMGKISETSFKQTRTFSYNAEGLLSAESHPEFGFSGSVQRSKSYSYNADGTLDTKTNPNGQVLKYVYDSNKRLIRIESPVGTVKTTFTYDTAPNGVGRLAAASNDGYTQSYAYDLMGRITTQTLTTPYYCNNPFPYCAGNWAAVASFNYDPDGRLVDLRYPGSLTFTGQTFPPNPGPQPGTWYQYTYDLLSRPLTLQMESSPEVWITLAQGATYNAAGQLTGWQEGSGTLTRTYNAQRGWLERLTAAQSTTMKLDLTYSYFPNGRVQSVNDAVNPTQSATYSYDDLNRLKTAVTSEWGLSWSYDEFGNRTAQTATLGAPPTSTLAYDPATNRITTSGYNYSDNGNLTAMPGKTMTYDVFDRLASITVSGTTTTAKYDAFGRRVERSLPGGSKRIYFYDPAGRLLAEYDNLPADYFLDTAEYSYWLATPVRPQQYFAGQRLGQWTDRRGDVRYSSGGWKHYYPYGEEITSTTNDTYKFAQLYRDGDTGLDYAINRFYAAQAGRFTTPDPLLSSAQADEPSTWNRYRYSSSDPVNRVDPSGLFDFWVELLLIGPEGTSGGGWPCIWDPLGGRFSGTNWYCLLPAIIPVVVQQSTEPKCKIELHTREINWPDEGPYTIRGMHAYWFVTDRNGAPWIISGGPMKYKDADGQERDYLEGWKTQRLQDGENNPAADPTAWEKFGSVWCPFVDSLLRAVDSFPKHKVLYHGLNGPNSNSYARYIGNQAGLFPPQPNVRNRGWGTKIPGLE